MLIITLYTFTDFKNILLARLCFYTHCVAIKKSVLIECSCAKKDGKHLFVNIKVTQIEHTNNQKNEDRTTCGSDYQ